jgi:rubredoxin
MISPAGTAECIHKNWEPRTFLYVPPALENKIPVESGFEREMLIYYCPECKARREMFEKPNREG